MPSPSPTTKQPSPTRPRNPASVLPGDHTRWMAAAIEVLSIVAAVVFAYHHTAA